MATSISGSTGVTYPAGGLDNIAGAGVGTTDTQTLTNKTLTSPTVNSPTIGGTPVMGASVITSGTAVASTSGTSINYTSIPSWVKRITVMFNLVSLSGTSSILVQLGAGSIETTGYKAQSTISNTGSATINSTSGFVIWANEAAFSNNGNLIICTLGSNIWTASGVTGLVDGSSNSVVISGGSKTLSGTLDRVRITTVNGTDTFDAGSVNILFE